jgi:glycosyltransferase involved in cell wall biosynthesis
MSQAKNVDLVLGIYPAPDVDFVESPSDSTLIDLYQRCIGVLFPAQNEDWGLVPLEAMACGKPVIAVNRGGPTESLLHGETGFLVPDRPQDFAAALTLLAHASSAELDALGVRARARAWLHVGPLRFQDGRAR